MASSLFTLSLLLASALAATANNPCCDQFMASFDSTTFCSLSKCRMAGSFTSHPDMVEFMDGCRDHNNLNTTIQIAQCFARQMPRSLYHAFTARSYDDGPGNHMQANVASLVIAYGCFRRASTSTCRKGLEKAIFTDHPNSILGLVPERFSDGPVHANLTLENLIGPCISPPGTFNNSEFDNGMAECAAVGGSGSISGHAIPANDGQQCYPCSLYSTTEQPFCSEFFLPGRSGARCNQPRLMDRIAQAYYSGWNRTGRFDAAAGFGFDLPKLQACHNLVKEMACRLTIGECDSGVVRTVCSTTCQNRLFDDCQVSTSVAAQICQRVGANRTGAACPPARRSPTTMTTQTTTEIAQGSTAAPAATTSAASTSAASTSAASQSSQPHYILQVSSNSPNGTEINVSICFTQTLTDSAQHLIVAALNTEAVTDEVGHNTAITGFQNVSDAGCTFRYIITLTMLPDSANHSSPQDNHSSPHANHSSPQTDTDSDSAIGHFQQTASRALGLKLEDVTVISKNIRIPILVEQTASTANPPATSGQSTVSAVVALVMAALCAALYQH